MLFLWRKSEEPKEQDSWQVSADGLRFKGEVRTIMKGFPQMFRSWSFLLKTGAHPCPSLSLVTPTFHSLFKKSIRIVHLRKNNFLQYHEGGHQYWLFSAELQYLTAVKDGICSLKRKTPTDDNKPWTLLRADGFLKMVGCKNRNICLLDCRETYQCLYEFHRKALCIM